MNMYLIPNFLSILRFPLALVFLQDNPFYRVLAIGLAMLTDGLDGFIARRYHLTSRLGTILDPFSDKFFVLLVVSILLQEGKFSFLEAITLFCRDLSVFFFGLYLIATKKWENYQIKAFWCGKITTCLQFIVLLGLTLGVVFPPIVFVSFIILGFLALVELYKFPIWV